MWCDVAVVVLVLYCCHKLYMFILILCSLCWMIMSMAAYYVGTQTDIISRINFRLFAKHETVFIVDVDLFFSDIGISLGILVALTMVVVQVHWSGFFSCNNLTGCQWLLSPKSAIEIGYIFAPLLGLNFPHFLNSSFSPFRLLPLCSGEVLLKVQIVQWKIKGKFRSTLVTKLPPFFHWAQAVPTRYRDRSYCRMH